ncbi:MAG TPA: hypothetical protein VGN42_05115 [Pirellulales bacterium]|jgi:stress-induced morphogen|nr:hypothetical protein [Pirellulales bacterium]
MSHETQPAWRTMQTEETRSVERVLRDVFPSADAYRYNSASIRVRVIDPRFSGKSRDERDGMVEPLLKTLPEATQADIINLLTLAPEETTGSLRTMSANEEFESPTPSSL